MAPKNLPIHGLRLIDPFYVLARAVMADPASEQPFTLPFLPQGHPRVASLGEAMSRLQSSRYS
ncbi:MAG: hypothetical protein U0P48_11430 [Ancrocorticia sp.]